MLMASSIKKFRGFFVHTSLQCQNALDVPKPWHFLSFAGFYISQAFHTSAKTIQNRTWSLSNTASNKDCAKNSFWCRVWKGLGVSWASFGRLLGHLGCLLAPLRGFLGASWALLGCSWPSFGWSGALLGRISAPRDAPDPDSGGFGDVPGKVLEGSKGMF